MLLPASVALSLCAALGGAVVTQIPSWDLVSTAQTSASLPSISQPNFDTSSWRHIPAPFCTLIGCLLKASVYNDTDLFFSDNLRRKPEPALFTVPWIYRNEFKLSPAPGRHFFLQTHGIASRADIFLNGNQVADKSVQVGSYAGHRYDITSSVAAANALAIKVYPTDPNRDLAIGWVDWNPWPADNGTGVWRAVEIKETGSVVLEPMRVIAFLDTPLVQGTYTIRIKAKNLEDKEVRVLVEMGVTLVGSGAQAGGDAKYVRIGAGREVDVVFEGVVQAPEIWWPAQWGKQPLYNVKLAVKDADGTVSDEAETNFGFRVVQRRLNEFNDSLFIVNRREFQVLGGGYAPDMFLRWDPARWEKELQYALDLGLNTVRLEGKNEHPELYDIADRMGVMIMAGWECCDKWEAWDYNTHMERPSLWTDEDYATANASMRHEAAMMQPHPSVLTYLIGSDFWPNERATTIYLNAFKSVDWQTPVLGSASRQGFSPQTGSPGMLMEGPYDWVPPNYFFDNQPARGGSAYGFGSELSAGVGTPDLSSLKKFLSSADLDDLWKNPRKDLFHMSTAGSTFHNRKIYNDALWARLGAPTSLEDYVQKSQITDYEATRAQFEAWGSMWNAPRPATGVIYWMLTGAFPSLHWNLWDYYMRPSGGYFGAKTALRPEHVAYDPVRKVVHLINRSLDKSGKRALDMSVIDTAGQSVYSGSVQTSTEPNTSKNITSLATALDGAKDLVLLRLTLSDDKNATLSRNTYWIPRTLDALDFGRRDWYYTPVSRYSDYTALSKLGPANVTATATKQGGVTMVALENLSTVPAFFVSLALLDSEGADVLPLKWSDNYVTLWPREKLSLTASTLKGAAEPVAVGVVGRNVARGTVRL